MEKLPISLTAAWYKPAVDQDPTSVLTIDWGENHLALTAKTATDVLLGFELFEFINDPPETICTQVIAQSKLLAQPAPQRTLRITHPHFFVAPQTKIDNTILPSYCHVLFGDLPAACSYFTKKINLSFEGVSAYSIPKNTLALGLQYFNYTGLEHSYHIILQQTLERKDLPHSLLKIIVFKKSFLLILLKNRTLAFIQTFSFTTPSDVLYYLTQTCDAFDLDFNKLPIEYSGLIRTDSDLYIELKQYIKRLNPDKTTPYPSPITNLPSHYISYFLS